MQEVFADVRAPGSPLPDPEGRPLTPGTGDASLAPADVNILPSELSAPATNDVYVRLVNYIKENQHKWIDNFGVPRSSWASD